MNEIESQSLEKITDQVVVVTGGAGVIGRAICEAFGRAGAAVVVADLANGPREALVAAIQKAGERAIGVHLDVANGASVDAMVESVERELGPIDLLINNAGLLGAIGPIWEVDPEEWWRVWEVNVRGSMLCSRAVLRGMVTRRKGRIINMSSGSVLGPSHAFSAYPVSKTAITRLTEHFALDAREYGISVFAITPGLVDTPLARQTYESAAGIKWTSQYKDVYQERQVPPELAAERCIEIASGRADALSGCYIQLADDIDELVRRSEQIAAEGLYTLKIRGETATPITPRVADTRQLPSSAS